MSASILDSNEPPLYSWFMLFFALVAVSSAGAVLLLMGDVPPLMRASWRLQATALVLLPGFVWQYHRSDALVRKRLREAKTLLVLAGSGAALTIHFGSWVWSLDHTSLTHSLLFVTSHPLVIVLIGILWKANLSASEKTWAIIGFFSAAITLLDYGNDKGVTLYGDGAAFIGAVSVVGYMMAGKMLRRWMPLHIYAFPVTFIAAVGLSSWSLLVEPTTSIVDGPYSLLGWLDWYWLPLVGWLAIGPGYIGHTGLNATLRHLSPLVISVALTMEPVIGSFLGWVIGISSAPGMWTWIGGPLMLLASIQVSRSSISRMKEVGDEVIPLHK